MVENSLVYSTLKRAFDVSISILALITLSPLILTVSLSIWISMGLPVLFRQKRPGLHGHPFRLVKFRTMTDAHSATGELLPDEKRLTRLGRFLRRWSLDELPQLWNVLMGDISLVGPRPLLMRYLERYTTEQMRRHNVKPGITGWAQVNGRNSITWEEKFEYDLWYVENRSFILDLKILWLTLRVALWDRTASPKNAEVMEEFMGTGSLNRVLDIKSSSE